MDFVCTEIDQTSIEFALKNIENNGLQERIEIIQVDQPEKVLDGVIPNEKM
jgi:23S rRNA A1618 N6-methylase RlmF